LIVSTKPRLMQRKSGVIQKPDVLLARLLMTVTQLKRLLSFIPLPIVTRPYPLPTLPRSTEGGKEGAFPSCG
jgi:hypothetical protein